MNPAAPLPTCGTPTLLYKHLAPPPLYCPFSFLHHFLPSVLVPTFFSRGVPRSATTKGASDSASSRIILPSHYNVLPFCYSSASIIKGDHRTAHHRYRRRHWLGFWLFVGVFSATVQNKESTQWSLMGRRNSLLWVKGTIDESGNDTGQSGAAGNPTRACLSLNCCIYKVEGAVNGEVKAHLEYCNKKTLITYP